jgi:hypothetical protein
MQVVISIFLDLLRLALCPKIWPILRMFYRLRRMYIVLMLDAIFCRRQLSSFHRWCHLVLGFHFLIFCLDDLSIGDRGVLKSPTTTVLGSICDFKSFKECLMKLGALKMGAYRLIIVISLFVFLLLLV